MYLDCCRVTKPVQERIRIIENDDELENIGDDLITIILQTEEGRKSRIRFLISKV